MIDRADSMKKRKIDHLLGKEIAANRKWMLNKLKYQISKKSTECICEPLDATEDRNIVTLNSFL